MNSRHIHAKETIFLFCFFVISMLGLRVLITGSFGHFYLLWNIFLGLVPVFFAGILAKQTRLGLISLPLFFGWYIFFPNALYLITDLVHIRTDGPIAAWYDIVLFFSAAILGILLAFISLHRAEIFLKKVIRHNWIWVFRLFIFVSGAFGVYAGRVLRWNSWDVIHQPATLLNDMCAIVFHPYHHKDAFLFTAVFSVFSLLLYRSFHRETSAEKIP